MDLIVPLPASIEGRDFEETLDSFLAKSRQSKTKSITFDMSRVEWCELYELSLLTVWLWDLSARNKSLSLVYPLCEPHADERENRQAKVARRKRVCAYLNRWDFDKFLKIRGIPIEGHDQDYPYWPPAAEQNSILPLRFFQDATDFQTFLANLSDTKQMELLFQDSVLLSVIGSGGMRDVILKEVGQNVYDHADGRCAFCTIGVIPAVHSDSHLSYRKLNHPIEAPFFRTLGRSGYLQVVLADHGPGICAKLVETYKLDERISLQRRAAANPIDVIAYAFEYDSTSKNRNDFSPPADDEDPGRGLFWVREIVLQNKGFLSVRSGAHLVGFDFLNSNDRHSLKAYVTSKRTSQLASLGGTQFKLLFPLNPELISRRVELRSSAAGATRREARPQPTYFVIELPHQALPDPVRRLDELKTILESIPHPLGQDGHSFVVVLDFSHTAWQKDVLVPFLVRVSALQHDGIVAILSNTVDLSQLLSIASPILSEKVGANPLKLRCLTVWNTGRGIEVLGIPEEDRSTLLALLSGESSKNLILDNNIEHWLQRYGHLLDLSSEGTLLPKISNASIENSLASYYKNRIRAIAFDERAGIYHEGKFLLPTNVYVDGYFQLVSLFKDDHCRRLIRFALVNLLHGIGRGVEGIITISSDLEALGREIAEDLGASSEKPIIHVHLGDLHGKEIPRNILAPLRGKSAVILTSVLGTARTLEAILDACRFLTSPIQIPKIICCIDARDTTSLLRRGSEIVEDKFSYEGVVYPLGSVVVHPLRFYDSRPASWRREEIVRIDPSTNAPTPLRVEPATTPLWQPVDRFFLENIVFNSGALHVGHYVRRTRHYIYFIDMVNIAEEVGPEVAGKVKSDVASYCANSQSGDPDVSHVVFDESSRGTQVIADQISKLFSHVTPLSIQSLASATRPQREALIGRDVIIYVSSVARGNHLQYLIDIVASCKPRRIFAYAITHRRESDSVPFYQRIDNYYGIELRIRYFVELEIPAFTVWDCPACNMLSRIKELNTACDDGQLKEYLQHQWETLAPQMITDDVIFDKQDPEENREFIQRAVLRRALGAAKTELQARYPLADLLEGHSTRPDEALRLLEVLAREIILFSTYEELFYPEFRRLLNETCLDFLVQPSDVAGREKFALTILRHVSPDFLVTNLPTIFKGAAFRQGLAIYLFVELFALIALGGEDSPEVLDAIKLCQSALDTDERFVRLPVEGVLDLHHMLSYLARRIRIRQVRSELKEASVQFLFTRLWRAFIQQPGKVHPEFVQMFTHVISIHSLASFRDTYASSYEGTTGFGAIFDQIIPLFEELEAYLRAETRNNLVYFFSRGEGSFAGDLEVIDDSLHTLATLDRQNRLTEEHIDRLFFNSMKVNSSIERLRRNAFDDNSILRQTLRGKFSSVDQAIRGALRRWERALSDRGVSIEFKSRKTEVFVPESVLHDVVSSFLSNVYKHAFTGSETRPAVMVGVGQELGTILITIQDNGKGIEEDDLNSQRDSGIRRASGLLARYKGTVRVLGRSHNRREEGAPPGTTVEIRLLSKEEVLSWEKD